MNFKHLVETQLLQSNGCGSCAQKSAMYDDFTEKVLRLYNEATDHKELISQLVCVNIELSDAIQHQPDNRYLVKASCLVQETLSNVKLELKHQTLTTKEMRKKNRQISSTYKWATDDVHFVELVYGLIESKSIENTNGDVKINELAAHLGAFFGLNIRDAHDTYSSTIKRRVSDGRTYFLRWMAHLLDMKIYREDGTPPPASLTGHVKTLFDNI